ncbi:MAG: 5,10-methylenetetrahydromethanopterin reductase [Theionarchaea archaeon]|nr:5,10-methylenetetrahydromethanopterin reductase [Theionarchaea archaeon]MBU7001831.1 5,10-methylenetetrahydromethanopterin reductase [Theionarchaea archaeon]MBU7020934.1 5,10-methylenetetrahydromethanopterin reductase [Theionarchaea archaeon]MBU7033988.1 5,10-methylenetetrahydromethanopterin reductase [Theionarchaea archaeon]MBU7040987.1 5,10-methylenetetrahydromethanopterin reductase [Theionarchaea archaeon]
MKFGIEFSPEKPTYEVAYYSRDAEDAGFHHVWITDHYNNRNIYSTMTDIAYRTNRILIGSAVTNPYVSSPVWTASAIFTIDEISGGRAVFGIGAGDKMTLNAIGIKWERPLAAVKEAVEIFRELNETKKCKYNGTFFNVPNARVKKNPSHRIPVYVGAQGPKMLQMSAALADGVLVNASHPRDFDPAVKALKEGAAQAGRTFSELDVAAYTSFSIDEKQDKAIKKARIVAGAIAVGSPDFVLERHGIEPETKEAIREMVASQDFKTMKEGGVPDHVVEAFSIAGTPEDCVEKIDALGKAGVTQIVTGMPLGKSKTDAIKLIKKEVIPHF